MPEASCIQIDSVEFRGALVWCFTDSSQATCVILQLVVKETGCIFTSRLLLYYIPKIAKRASDCSQEIPGSLLRLW